MKLEIIWWIFCWFLPHIHGLSVSTKDYLNVWAVKINGNLKDARQIADQHGYDMIQKLDGFDNVYIMKKRNLSNRLKRHISNFTDQLLGEPSVLWAEQQEVSVRVKRNIVLENRKVSNQTTQDKRGNSVSHIFRNFVDNTRQFVFSFGFDNKNMKHKYNDELWPYQWYLNSPGFSRFDHGITKVWEMGYTGSGVVVSVLDDGLEWNHSDLRSNYDNNASYDMNDDDDDPTPRYDINNSNGHGTRCAGEISMAPQNKKCGVGVAYNAKIGGIRCLDGEVSDILEARSLSFKNDYIDIYSSSWGPNDDGMTVDGPKLLAIEALNRGVTHGRKGKGCIYVWASGNGGSKGDNCNCDGYVSSIYTISIGSVSESGQFPWYGEKCASTLAVAYSSGAYSDKKIPTTDIHNTCTMEHSGTSAAAPIAAGIFALVLEANPNLTWRDVQHLIVCTSEFSPIAENKGWKRNAAGFMYNSRFGFGLLTAPSMVKTALKWENVPQKFECVIKAENMLPVYIEDGTVVKVSFSNNNFEKCPIRYLEHVQVKVHLHATRRGNIRVFMFSPHDTLSVLMHPRFKDNSNQGFNNVNFTSVQYWGENPHGNWRLYLQNSKRDGSIAILHNVELILHGISEAGGCLRQKPARRYINEDLIPAIIDHTPEYYEDANGIFSNMFSNPFDKFFENII